MNALVAEQSKQALSVKINTQLYQQLKNQIGKGKISEFVERTLTEKLAQKEQELESAYQEIAQDKKR
nr:13489_t:CDS:2 [Entrophospora candida]